MNNIFVVYYKVYIEMFKIALLILILLYVWYYGVTDSFIGCAYCDTYTMPSGDLITLNPFVWPYSGTPCPSDIYIMENDRGVNKDNHIPLVSASVPDHSVNTN